MKKHSKGANTHPSRHVLRSGTIDRPRTQDDKGDVVFLAVLHNELILFQLGETVGFSPFHRIVFERAVLVEQSAAADAPIPIDGTRADIDKPPQRAPETR